MASDYKKISEDHEKRYGWDAKPRRIYKKLYSDKTHFVYELIQNADDSGSPHLELQLDKNGLLIWNDGRQFTEQDVRSICSLGSSDKDLTHIGTFGIGFKAVYNYTDSPEIYSGDEHFRIRDFVKSESIDEMNPEIVKLVNEGKTIFSLPFKESLHQVDDIEHLKDRLRNLSKERSLLFLRNLKRVEWKDEHNAQTGSYACHRQRYDKIQNVPENESVELVELIGVLNGNNQPSEKFLIFSKEVQPPECVIDKLSEQAEDEEEQQRIQQSAEELQPIEVAFKLQDDRITAMDDNCVLFAYLPTQKETHLRFLIQARYQTTPARDNIPKPSENPWNEWLVQETAEFLPEVLEELKEAGLLEPTFFNILPLKGKVENEFKPIAEALQTAMQERAFVPTQNGGYAKAETVFYPHRESLLRLIESSWLYPGSSWLHQDIGLSGHAFNVMKEAGVKEINVSQVLNWLEKQDINWFENRCKKWLRSLYVYLNTQKSQLERIKALERIKKLPLVRLENGRHVCASEAFFPPETDEEHEEIDPFLNELPILQSALLEGEHHNDVKSFLEDLEVEGLHPENLINKSIFPLYRKSDKPSVMENRLHVRYIFKVWDKLSGYQHRNLRKEISKTPILWAYNGDQPETFDFVKPCDVYLPKAYTGDDNLETYFSVYNGDIWFVDHIYLEDDSDQKDWIQFLKAIGFMDTPRSIKKTIRAKSGYDQEFSKELNKRDIKSEYTIQWHNHWSKTSIEDFYLEGLSEVLTEISEHKRINLSQVLWHLLVKILLSEPKRRDAFFKGTYYWSYYGPKSEDFEAMFYDQLKEFAWLLDEQGKLRQPSELFAPTDENRKVLGDSVAYLHPDFDVSQDSQTARWLAEKLGVHLNADTNSVLNHLRTLSGTEASVKDVEPLYRFLNRQDARRSEEFKKNRLIFTPNPESRWWRVDEVFWEDKSEVLENDRRCLKAHYPAILKPFFINLGVSEQASQRDYACRIQEIATTEQAADKKVRERLLRLYKCLITCQKNEWEIIYDDRCWLGKEGKEWGFFTRQELVLKDHPHIGEIFEGKMPFWNFDDDSSSLARILRVEGCSQAEVEFHPEGDQEEDTDWSEKVRKLRPYIYAFLNSPRLCEEPDIFRFSGNEELQKEKFAKFSTNCSVRQVKELRVTYELKGISVIDPNPRPSFLDITGQQAILWLGLEAHEDEYAELIGDALQDHFGVNELGRFVEDLLTPIKKQDRVLYNWKRKGLDTKFLNEDPKDNEEKRIESLDEPNSGEADPAADESNMKIPTDNETPKTGNEDSDSLTDEADKSETRTDSLDTQVSTETRGVTSQSIDMKSEHETSTTDENPEIDDGDTNSLTKGSGIRTYTPSRTSGTSRSGGHSLSTSSNRGSGGGGHGGSGSGGESDEHRELKKHLAANTSELDTELKLVKVEHTFGSGDRVDILLKDSSENPVTVEVETGFSSGTGRYVGVWQAVKYQHLAAMECGLACEQVRSILAAPEIPDDVKTECEKLGIEPIEVSNQTEDTDE